MCGAVVCKESAQIVKLQAQESNLCPGNSPYPGRYIIQKRVTVKMLLRGVHLCIINFRGSSELKTEKE